MFRYQSTRTLHRLTRSARPTTLTTRFLGTTQTRFAAKNTQDKDSLNPQSTEYSKSGSDDAAASSDAAFNPNKTSPEAAEKTAEKEDGGNSLDVSPGNEKVSRPNSSGVGGNGAAPDKKQSGGGSAPKSGGSGGG